MRLFEGSMTAFQVKSELERLIPGWSWDVDDGSVNEFFRVTAIPSVTDLDRMVRWGQ